MVVSDLGIITLVRFQIKLTRFKGNFADLFLKMAECRAGKSWAYFSQSPKIGGKFLMCCWITDTNSQTHSSLFMLRQIVKFIPDFDKF